MHKPHCDLCDAVVELYQRWVQFDVQNQQSHIVHLQAIGAREEEPDYCASCWKRILTKMLEVLS